MDKRPNSSLSIRPDGPRPSAFRKRSNSFPISEALGCSTPEAELILAEGRAAVRSRLADRQRGRRNRDGIETFNPRDHIAYLRQRSQSPEKSNEAFLQPVSSVPRHSRTSSNTSDATDCSTSTIVALHQPTTDDAPSIHGPKSPLNSYSANLAQFIQSQLNSIPAYHYIASTSPRSCPDLSFPMPMRSPVSPAARAEPSKRHVAAPSLIEIPAVRPPARSAFSAWSSTDDEADDEEDDSMATESSQASVLRYYEQTGTCTYPFSTNLDGHEYHPDATLASSPHDDVDQDEHEPSRSANGRTSSLHTQDYMSSVLSRMSLETSASTAPSLTSTSSGSYFESTMPEPGPDSKDVTLSVAPCLNKVIPAISPFEGAALAHIHDVYVQSQQRVRVDGLTFDMMREFNAPSAGMNRVSTPC